MARQPQTDSPSRIQLKQYHTNVSTLNVRGQNITCQISLGERAKVPGDLKENKQTLKSSLCTTTVSFLRIITAPTLRDTGGAGGEGAEQKEEGGRRRGGAAVQETAVQRQRLTGQTLQIEGDEIDAPMMPSGPPPDYVLGA